MFHTATGTAHADLAIDGHRETWPVRSPRFRAWLRRRYYEATGDALSAAALNAALNLLEARAQFDGPERTVHVRVAEHEGRIYLDLADQAWRAVEIGPDGWRVVGEPPVRFRRPAGLLPLPIPQRGGSLGELRSFLNLPGEDDLVLVAAWLLATLRHGGPYPLLVISGEQGSAKTVLSKMLRALIDPNAAPARTLPREERDLFIAANNGHVLAFDNVSALPAWLSDTLCRLASGGSFAVRRLYTDEDEVLFEAARPVILNGIEDVITRPDLADRALFLTLPSISDARRRPEIELWREFELARPRLLGALLDAASHGLRVLPDVRLQRLPRMADFARLGGGMRNRAVAFRHVRARLRGQPQGCSRGCHRRRPVGRLRARAHGRARLLEGQRRRPAAYRRRSQQRRHREGWHRLAQKSPRACRPLAARADVLASARHRGCLQP